MNGFSLERIRGLALAGLSGFLQVAIFPNFNFWFFAPVTLVPLLWAVRQERRAGWRFVLGWVAGAVFWGGVCYWIYWVLHVYGSVPAAGAAALFIGFFAVKGLHLGVFALLAAGLLESAWAIPAVAALWVAIEGTHPYAGFTWLMLGSAATNMSVVARLAPLTGVEGMSFVLAMMNAAIALALWRRPKTHLAWLLAVPLLYALPGLPRPEAGSHLARLVQPNISEEELFASPWTASRQHDLQQEFRLLSASGPRAEQRPELIVWPENPAPLYFYTDPEFRNFTQELARQEHAYLLFGTVAYRGGNEREPLNSAVLLGTDGAEIARYDKIFLVPFGEFVPWPFGSLVEKVTREAGDYVAGDRVVVARAAAGEIGTFICYESAFASGVRRFVAGGAEVLANISNDGWFGHSAARDQHLLIARMRAMENGRWVLRATNSGLTASIDPAGRVIDALPRDKAAALDARFDYRDRKTLYTRRGDWFWWVSVAGAGAGVVLRRSRRRGEAQV